jgi:hypothetical protein
MYIVYWISNGSGKVRRFGDEHWPATYKILVNSTFYSPSESFWIVPGTLTE